MVTAWWRRGHAARWYLNGNAIGWTDSTFSANWAKLREEKDLAGWKSRFNSVAKT
jgi:hypothetical protein